MIARSLVALALLTAAANAAAAAPEPLQHELLVFGSAEGAYTPNFEFLSSDADKLLLTADVLFSLQDGPFQVFGEYLLTNHESDLERFQLGWTPSSHLQFWLGRFHQASSVWNSEHHHGQYLQTSITRPVSENWEDDGGIIPQHITGLLAESTWDLAGGRMLKIAFGGGLTPVITASGLEPFNLLEPNASKEQLGYQGRVALFTDDLEESGAGLLFSHDKMQQRGEPLPANPTLQDVDFQSVGLYGMYVHESWKFNAVGFYVDTTLNGASRQDSSFLIGYVAVEDALNNDWRIFGRLEGSTHASESAYLALFPNFVARRATLGVRWDFARRHAFTLQVADSHTALHRFTDYRLQWSAALL
jgi:hypothetical protein